MKDDDQPAFLIGTKSRWPGISKRELFAAMAMQGMLSNEPEERWPVELLAKWSVKRADALIAALGEPT